MQNGVAFSSDFHSSCEAGARGSQLASLLSRGFAVWWGMRNLPPCPRSSWTERKIGCELKILWHFACGLPYLDDHSPPGSRIDLSPANQDVSRGGSGPEGRCKRRADALKEERKDPAGRPAGEPGLVSTHLRERLTSSFHLLALSWAGHFLLCLLPCLTPTVGQSQKGPKFSIGLEVGF